MNERDFSDELELFFGRAADTVARVYARFPAKRPDEPWQLTGSLRGPSCAYAKTLQATFAFVDCGPGDSLLAEAVVPEPSFWTAEMPQLYEAEIQLRRGGECLARTTRMFGIRRLGAARRRLSFDGKGWVLRGAARHHAATATLSQWREADLAMLINNPSEEFCQEASRVGVLLAVELDAIPDRKQIQRLSRWPSVGLVVLGKESALDSADRPPNLLFVERFGLGESVAPAPWAGAVMCGAGDLGTWKSDTADCPVPVVAFREPQEVADLSQARAMCDRLQRDLADRGEIAGYMV